MGEEVSWLPSGLLFAFEQVRSRALLFFTCIRCLAIGSLVFCRQSSYSGACDPALIFGVVNTLTQIPPHTPSSFNSISSKWPKL